MGKYNFLLKLNDCLFPLKIDAQNDFYVFESFKLKTKAVVTC